MYEVTFIIFRSYRARGLGAEKSGVGCYGCWGQVIGCYSTHSTPLDPPLICMFNINVCEIDITVPAVSQATIV